MSSSLTRAGRSNRMESTWIDPFLRDRVLPMFSLLDTGHGTRREFLQVGGVSALGLSLAQVAAANNPVNVPKSCIFLWLSGGPSQLETWDPKPAAPAEIRGEFAAISTAVPGYRCCELMPRTAQLMDRISVLRAVATDCGIHDISGFWLLTGQKHRKMGQNVEAAGELSPQDWPALASVVRRLTQRPGGLPAAVLLPEQITSNPFRVWPGQNGGFLGRKWDPWLVPGDPNAPDYRVPDLVLSGEIPPLRLDRRLSLLEQVNRHFTLTERSDFDEASSAALELLKSPRARSAFDLVREPTEVRDRYGRHKFGQSCLLARRLVEAGVRFVQVNWPRVPGDETSNAPVWDTHAQNAQRMRHDLMPPMDAAYSALVEDLEQRGLLDSTLVVWIGEFGRTPRHNTLAGRDHWGHVFSVALAGGGIGRGIIHGASDEIAGFPLSGRVEPQDLAATILQSLGFGPETQVRDALGRPLAVTNGEVISTILA